MSAVDTVRLRLRYCKVREQILIYFTENVKKDLTEEYHTEVASNTCGAGGWAAAVGKGPCLEFSRQYGFCPGTAKGTTKVMTRGNYFKLTNVKSKLGEVVPTFNQISVSARPAWSTELVPGLRLHSETLFWKPNKKIPGAWQAGGGRDLVKEVIAGTDSGRQRSKGRADRVSIQGHCAGNKAHQRVAPNHSRGVSTYDGQPEGYQEAARHMGATDKCPANGQTGRWTDRAGSPRVTWSTGGEANG